MGAVKSYWMGQIEQAWGRFMDSLSLKNLEADLRDLGLPDEYIDGALDEAREIIEDNSQFGVGS